jgi:hypothetical protein
LRPKLAQYQFSSAARVLLRPEPPTGGARWSSPTSGRTPSRTRPCAAAASRPPRTRASLPWALLPRPPLVPINPLPRLLRFSFSPNPSYIAPPLPRNPSAPLPPSIFRTAALRSLRSRPVAPSQGEEAASVAHWSPRAVYRPRALTGGRRREPSAPPSRASSPMFTRRPRHPRRDRRGPHFTLVQAACLVVHRRSKLSELAGATPVAAAHRCRNRRPSRPGRRDRQIWSRWLRSNLNQVNRSAYRSTQL